jgi:hypothetical protein
MMPIGKIDFKRTSRLTVRVQRRRGRGAGLGPDRRSHRVGHSLTRELSVSVDGVGTFQHSNAPKTFGKAGAVVLSALKAHESGARGA